MHARAAHKGTGFSFPGADAGGGSRGAGGPQSSFGGGLLDALLGVMYEAEQSVGTGSSSGGGGGGGERLDGFNKALSSLARELVQKKRARLASGIAFETAAEAASAALRAAIPVGSEVAGEYGAGSGIKRERSKGDGDEEKYSSSAAATARRGGGGGGGGGGGVTERRATVARGPRTSHSTRNHSDDESMPITAATSSRGNGHRSSIGTSSSSTLMTTTSQPLEPPPSPLDDDEMWEAVASSLEVTRMGGPSTLTSASWARGFDLSSPRVPLSAQVLFSALLLPVTLLLSHAAAVAEERREEEKVVMMDINTHSRFGPNLYPSVVDALGLGSLLVDVDTAADNVSFDPADAAASVLDSSLMEWRNELEARETAAQMAQITADETRAAEAAMIAETNAGNAALAAEAAVAKAAVAADAAAAATTPEEACAAAALADVAFTAATVAADLADAAAESVSSPTFLTTAAATTTTTTTLATTITATATSSTTSHIPAILPSGPLGPILVHVARTYVAPRLLTEAARALGGVESEAHVTIGKFLSHAGRRWAATGAGVERATLLHYAVYGGAAPSVSLLVALGAPLDIKGTLIARPNDGFMGLVGSAGSSPLALACDVHGRAAVEAPKGLRATVAAAIVAIVTEGEWRGGGGGGGSGAGAGAGGGGGGGGARASRTRTRR